LGEFAISTLPIIIGDYHELSKKFGYLSQKLFLLFYSLNPRSQVGMLIYRNSSIRDRLEEEDRIFSSPQKTPFDFSNHYVPSRQVGGSGRVPAAILGGVLCCTKVFNSELSLRAGCLLISPAEKDPTMIQIALKNKNMGNFKGVVEQKTCVK